MRAPPDVFTQEGFGVSRTILRQQRSQRVAPDVPMQSLGHTSVPCGFAILARNTQRRSSTSIVTKPAVHRSSTIVRAGMLQGLSKLVGKVRSWTFPPAVGALGRQEEQQACDNVQYVA